MASCQRQQKCMMCATLFGLVTLVWLIYVSSVSNLFFFNVSELQWVNPTNNGLTELRQQNEQISSLQTELKSKSSMLEKANEHIKKLTEMQTKTLFEQNTEKESMIRMRSKLSQQQAELDNANTRIQQLTSQIQQLKGQPIDENASTSSPDALGRKYGINFVRSMQNSLTKETIQCNPNKHKYIAHLLHQLESSAIIQSRQKTTSSDLEEDMKRWKHSEWFQTKQVRVQIINGRIYASADFMNEHDTEGYRKPALLFLHALMRKYSKYLPDTDFIWYYHDFKGYDYEHRHTINNSVVYLWCDQNMARNNGPLGDIFFLSVSRAWLKYRWLVDLYKHPNYKHLQLKNAQNKYSVVDYLHFREHYLRSLGNNGSLLWRNKLVNKALFRGCAENGRGIRRNVLYLLQNASFFSSWIAAKYFDVADLPRFGLLHTGDPRRMGIAEQLNFRYLIDMDGESVRDSLIYHMLYGAVVLKQLSTMHEYFYWDLVNNRHLITWETTLDLVNIVINLVDTMDVYLHQKTDDRMQHIVSNGTYDEEFVYLYERNMTYYNNKKLEEITKNAKRFIKDYFNDDTVDCYMIHLLQIYNKYVFDVDTLQLSHDDIMQRLYINITHSVDVQSALTS